MKAVVSKETGFAIFGVSDASRISFRPHLVIDNTGSEWTDYECTSIFESDVDVYEGLPDIAWKPFVWKVENGQWVDYSAQVEQARFEAVKADVLTKRDQILAACVDQTSPEWEAYKQALRDVEQLPGFPYTHQFPQRPVS